MTPAMYERVRNYFVDAGLTDLPPRLDTTLS